MLRRIIIAALMLMLPAAAVAHEIGEHADDAHPGIIEIVGGIGWIVGIFGFIAYLKSRKAK